MRSQLENVVTPFILSTVFIHNSKTSFVSKFVPLCGYSLRKVVSNILNLAVVFPPPQVQKSTLCDRLVLISWGWCFFLLVLQ